MNKNIFLGIIIFSNFLLWQACETISLLKQLWPEGSDIRRVLWVTSCSLSLRMYHHFLENRKMTTSDDKTKTQQVWLLSLYWEKLHMHAFRHSHVYTYYFIYNLRAGDSWLESLITEKKVSLFSLSSEVSKAHNLLLTILYIWFPSICLNIFLVKYFYMTGHATLNSYHKKW